MIVENKEIMIIAYLDLKNVGGGLGAFPDRRTLAPELPNGLRILKNSANNKPD